MAGYPTTGVQQVSPVLNSGGIRYDSDNTPQAAEIRASGGTVTLASGAGSLTGLTLTANSIIAFTLKTASGTIASQPYLTAISATAGTATVAAGGSDNSTYNFMVIG